jgi:hypothetical protein
MYQIGIKLLIYRRQNMNDSMLKIDYDFTSLFMSLDNKARALLIYLMGCAEQNTDKAVEMDIERLLFIYDYKYSRKVIEDIYNLSGNGISIISLIKGVDDNGYFEYQLSNDWRCSEY